MGGKGLTIEGSRKVERMFPTLGIDAGELELPVVSITNSRAVPVEITSEGIRYIIREFETQTLRTLKKGVYG